MDIRIEPSRLSGTVAAVPSKSDAHRLLICAALSGSPTRLYVPRLSEDIEATASCLRALGADITYSDGYFTVTPGPPAAAPALDCRESGSTLRFLLPVAAAMCCRASFTGGGKLPERPIGPLKEAMEAHGVAFSGGHLPLETRGRLTGGHFSIPGNVSSQFISGLLLALPLTGGGSVALTTDLQSAAYVDITISAMGRFGVSVRKTGDGFLVPPGEAYSSPGEAAAEGDWSNSAFFLTAGALGGDVTVMGLDPGSVQGDRHIADILESMGAEINVGAGISARPGALQGRTIDISPVPDLLPILAVAAAFSKGVTSFINGARLRLKESDRLASAARMINDLGGDARETEDGLTVIGKPLNGGTVDSFNDHRIVMSAAVAGAFCREPVIILGAQAVNKSYPTFFEDYKSLGGRAYVI